MLGAATILTGLALARYVESKSFLYGLVLAGAGIGLGACGLLALALGRRLFSSGTEGLVGAGLGLAAAGLRVGLILARPAPRPGMPTPPVLMWREILVGTPLALSAAAILLGAHLGLRTVSLPPGSLKQGRARLDLVGSVVALAGALYAFGPLFRSFGVPLNHVTFLGLVLLGLLAFALASALEWIFGLRGRKRR